MAKKSLFTTNHYELENSWTPVGNPQYLTEKEKASIKEIKIKRKQYESYEAVNAICFFVDGTKPWSFSVSPYSEAYNYPTGTLIDPDSFNLQEIVDDEGNSKVKCDCTAL